METPINSAYVFLTYTDKNTESLWPRDNEGTVRESFGSKKGDF